METIVWDESLSVGVSEIDDQHKRLIEFINELGSFIFGSRGDDNPIQSVLSGLFNYTIYHFFTEEQIMQETGYPNYSKHKTEHVNLTAEVISYLDRFVKGEKDIHLEVFEFLKGWLMGHIKVSDIELGRYLQGLHKINS